MCGKNSQDRQEVRSRLPVPYLQLEVRQTTLMELFIISIVAVFALLFTALALSRNARGPRRSQSDDGLSGIGFWMFGNSGGSDSAHHPTSPDSSSPHHAPHDAGSSQHGGFDGGGHHGGGFDGGGGGQH